MLIHSSSLNDESPICHTSPRIINLDKHTSRLIYNELIKTLQWTTNYDNLVMNEYLQKLCLQIKVVAHHQCSHHQYQIVLILLYHLINVIFYLYNFSECNNDDDNVY
ncbi:unnamed protein product [Rotaria magnacalcarata]|uniref:Uncharacterized protein n=1 Tax=Rotaria magnacalcarata TaxID=392030 RepID=A0A816TFD6_9BILA|nr:unnamed protein product [Rotaria magnacalcarata]CAF1616418.1 unnamed protein product [Rotaria magnacalcarata]CAF2036383.1 unnamed protein product [Rotaria magnacalcarata]CAF2100287.1 unnamed protein product [Rotaria magnacalcarata]CAF2241204.1 unnamed protein product [Rotaria magnacalcarata]